MDHLASGLPGHRSLMVALILRGRLCSQYSRASLATAGIIIRIRCIGVAVCRRGRSEIETRVGARGDSAWREEVRAGKVIKGAVHALMSMKGREGLLVHR